MPAPTKVSRRRTGDSAHAPAASRPITRSLALETDGHTVRRGQHDVLTAVVFMTAISSSPSASVSARIPAFLAVLRLSSVTRLTVPCFVTNRRLSSSNSRDGQTRRDLFSGLERQDVDDVRARARPALGGSIAPLAAYLPAAGEEEEIIVRRGGEYASPRSPPRAGPCRVKPFPPRLCAR